VGFWIDDILGYPNTRRLSPGARHAEIFMKFISKLDLRGNDMNDAWLAALAIENRATLVSVDRGFARFSRLDWLDPTTDL
ncbi:MAG: PIN domain-containing protein, partial [Candidatus Omnitrophica bacterium]|nr:PIN domain-containing protein [Candidatus Omnitrophota bacterium]